LVSIGAPYEPYQDSRLDNWGGRPHLVIVQRTIIDYA